MKALRGSALVILARIALLSTTALADPVPHAPEWDLSEHESDGKTKFFLEPPDGRPTIGVTPEAAQRLQTGTISPEDLYRDKKIAPAKPVDSEQGPSTISSSGSSTSHSQPSPSPSASSGPQYVKFNPNLSSSPPQGAPASTSAPMASSPPSASENLSSSGMSAAEEKELAERVDLPEQATSNNDVSVHYRTPKAPPGPQKKTFALGSASCSGSYCSCHDSNHAPSEAQANKICKDYKYTKAESFKTANGPKNVRQCFGGLSGTGCFINKYHGNLICTSVTCVK